MTFSFSVYADNYSDLKEVAVKKVKEQKLVDSFRKTLKEGDDTNCGPVIEVKSKLVKVSNAVANYGNEHWLKRDQIFPLGYTCNWFNGEYQPPQLKANQEEKEIRARVAEEKREQEQAEEGKQVAEEKRKQEQVLEAERLNGIQQGGLTWIDLSSQNQWPYNFKKPWPDANEYCANTAINGQTGWRLPTKDELISLDASGVIKKSRGLGQNLSSTWSSTPYSASIHYIGTSGSSNNEADRYVMCVR